MKKEDAITVEKIKTVNKVTFKKLCDTKTLGHVSTKSIVKLFRIYVKLSR